MEAEIIFEPHVPTALRRALEYAGAEGYVASMPQLLHARANADYDNIIWNTWFTSNTEESVVTTPQGNHVVVVVHGGGIFANPARFEKVYAHVERASPEGLTGQLAGKISEIEAHNVLDGKLLDGTEFPVFAFDEFKRGIAHLPLRYGVILDFDLAKNGTRDYDSFEILKDDPNMIVRAGGVDANTAYLDKYRDRHNTKLMGTFHPYKTIDADQPQTRIPFLAGNLGGTGTEEEDSDLYGYDSDYGIGGYACIHNMARYVAVAPHDVSTSLRNLDFGI
ncbi:MAG: hypothetical protein IIB74_08960 [Proteobacteria bacterium]|nr:hypothetical protein [Pseudomonadota bacterium]